jgi:hypothetical protein
MGFYLVAVYYNKTQHTNNTHHTNTAHKTTQTILDTVPTMKLLQLQQIQLQLQLNKFKRNSVAFSPQANYTDRSSDRRLSAKLVPTFADGGCCVVSATDPHGR